MLSELMCHVSVFSRDFVENKKKFRPYNFFYIYTEVNWAGNNQIIFGVKGEDGFVALID